MILIRPDTDLDALRDDFITELDKNQCHRQRPLGDNPGIRKTSKCLPGR